MWTIYAVVNTTNDRVYIGQTQQTVQERWKQHCSPGNFSVLGRAIQREGAQAFEVGALAVFDTQELANLREQQWIASLDSRNPDKGYNVALGGDCWPSLSPRQRPGSLGALKSLLLRLSYDMDRPGEIKSPEYIATLDEIEAYLAAVEHNLRSIPVATYKQLKRSLRVLRG